MPRRSCAWAAGTYEMDAATESPTKVTCSGAPAADVVVPTNAANGSARRSATPLRAMHAVSTAAQRLLGSLGSGDGWPSDREFSLYRSPLDRKRGGRGHGREQQDRKSTRLNSSHSQISYAVFCLK